MHRKVVFRGSLLTKDLSEEDRLDLAEAFATLHRLADKGTIEFQRNAGKTMSPGRKPDNVLTPQALFILRHADGVPDLHVADVTATLGMNRNSVTAHLYRLSEAGYLARRPVGGGEAGTHAGGRVVWAYAITDLGRDVVRNVVDETDEPDGPSPM